MAIEYISYIQIENLFKALPIIQGIKESLALELKSLGNGINPEEEDDYIYTSVIGNKVLSDIPPSGGISDTTCNTSASYEQVMKRDYFNTLESIKRDRFYIELVDCKLEIAIKRLTSIEQNILKLFYSQNRTWTEVLEKLKEERHFISKHQAQLKRKKAIERVQSISKITIDMYDYVMNLVEVE